jgi:hypothetical protein
MHCRTDSNAQVIGSAAALSGTPLYVVEKAFGALYREGLRADAAPADAAAVAAWVHARREQVKDAPDMGTNQRLLYKIGLAQVREQVEAGEVLPDGATWYAWQRILDEAIERGKIKRKRAAIYDIDGTLSDNGPMKDVPFPVAAPGEAPNFDEWMTYTVDLEANEWVRDATHEVDEDTTRIIITARNERYGDLTKAWLARIDARYEILEMRPDGDPRPDHEFKQEVLDRLEREYDFDFAMDDNPFVAQMWRDNGIETIVVPGYDKVHAPAPNTAPNEASTADDLAGDTGALAG